MAGNLDIWVVAHRDLADHAFGKAIYPRLLSIREGLGRHGYALKLDIGKRTTRATVTSKTLRAKSTYDSVEGFIQFEEERLKRMDAASATPSLTTGGTA